MASSAPRYARAFAEVAESARLDSTKALRQMRDFSETLAGSSELREFLENPSIETSAKLKVLDAIAGRIGMLPQVRNFIAVISEHHRLSELDQILAAYAELADEKRRRGGSARNQLASAERGRPCATGGADHEASGRPGSRKLRGGCQPAGRGGGRDRVDHL